MGIQLLTFLLHGMVQGAEVNTNRKLIDSDKDRKVAYKSAQWAKESNLGKNPFISNYNRFGW